MARPSGLSAAAIALSSVLTLAATAASAVEAFPGYGWGESDNEDGPSLVLGSTETTEDYVFLLSCDNADKTAEMTVYVDIEGAKVGEKVTIELDRDGTRVAIGGKTATDEMSGFVFATASGFPVKPVIAVLDGKGPVIVTTGKTKTALPEEDRAEELAKFAKHCRLD